MDYKIKINEFEGPLDLLLHLIKQSEMDIWDISIAEITSQYLSYINKMEAMQLEVASEYLTMAAELIYIKSKMLLPNENLDDDDDYVDDPRAELIKRLLEYKKYKEVTSEFKKLNENRQLFYTKAQDDLSQYMTDMPPLPDDINIYDLMSAFQKLMKRKALQKPLTTKVAKREISVETRVKEIKLKLQQNEELNFGDLFDIFNREYVVVTFLAILELAKQRYISINQDNNFDNIIIKLRAGE